MRTVARLFERLADVGFGVIWGILVVHITYLDVCVKCNVFMSCYVELMDGSKLPVATLKKKNMNCHER